MAEEKIYTPTTIEDNPFPSQDGDAVFGTSEKSTSEIFKPEALKPNSFPTRKIAFELLGSALNTKSRTVLATFSLAESGGFQIGKYVNGVSGDLRITPAGITARDSAGITTFVLDATTGDAIFRGTIQGGTLVSGQVVVGDNRVIIDGENGRIVVYDEDGIPRIVIGLLQGAF